MLYFVFDDIYIYFLLTKTVIHIHLRTRFNYVYVLLFDNCNNKFKKSTLFKCITVLEKKKLKFLSDNRLDKNVLSYVR